MILVEFSADGDGLPPNSSLCPTGPPKSRKWDGPALMCSHRFRWPV